MSRRHAHVGSALTDVLPETTDCFLVKPPLPLPPLMPPSQKKNPDLVLSQLFCTPAPSLQQPHPWPHDSQVREEETEA